jgi:exodeoxyribonuclease VII small subunit
MAKADATPAPEQTFETAIARLEKIVHEMDSPTLPLDQLVVQYEEGIQLVKVCEVKLKEAEQKIEMITRRAQGKPELSDFDPSAKPTENKPAAAARKDVNLF